MPKLGKQCISATATALAALLAGGAAQADAVSDFYKNKRFQILVGFAPGGGYDTYARVLARRIGEHIPGIEVYPKPEGF